MNSVGSMKSERDFGYFVYDSNWAAKDFADYAEYQGLETDWIRAEGKFEKMVRYLNLRSMTIERKTSALHIDGVFINGTHSEDQQLKRGF